MMRRKKVATCVATVAMAVCLVFGSLSAFGQEKKPGDEAVIQKMIDRAPEGGTVTLEARTYVLKDSITLKSNLTIQGAGQDKTVVRLADGVFVRKGEMVTTAANIQAVFEGHGAHDIAIKGMTIDGNAQNNEFVGECIFLATTYNYDLQDLHIVNSRGFGGIYTNLFDHEEKIFGKNYIIDCLIEGNLPAMDRDAPYGHGIYITSKGNNNVMMKRLVCRNHWGSGIHLEDFVRYQFVEDCDLYNNQQHGLWMAIVSDSVVRNCRIHHNQRGISVTPMSYRNLFINNDIYENNFEGIAFDHYGFETNTDDWRKVEGTYNVVIGNRIQNNNRSHKDAGAGIFCAFRQNVFAFNVINDTQVPEKQYIAIYATAPDNLIINNYMLPNAYRFNKDGYAGIEGNTVILWDYAKPWTPDNLVSWY